MVVVSHVLMGVIVNLLSVIPVFSVILALRLLLGVMSNTTLYSLAMEVCQIKHRPLMGVLIGLPWGLGTMAWGGMGYLIRDWRYLNAAVSLPFLIIFVFIFLIDESPRWLLVTGKNDKALRVMMKASRLNKVELPLEEEMTGLLGKIRPVQIEEHGQSVEERRQSGIQCRLPRMLSTPIMRRLSFINVTINFITALVFGGLNLSGKAFSHNPFLYMVIGGMMEVPCYTITAPIINRWGRKVPLMVGYFVCGVCMLSIVCVPTDMAWLVLTLAMVGKVTVSGAFMILLVYRLELQPTEVRLQSKGVGLLSTNVAYCVAPYITDLLSMVVSWLPSVIFGVTSLGVCVLLVTLPETHGMPLPETVKDLNNLWKRKWIWSSTTDEV
ncbi:organic cation transporter protein-like [Portunus trituberculatus]|uniref:organic cation transporter protein-like n=1 Tax=Portunus trituberculatus TaxID=210409 RepID=UPI001E1CC498|nr:organic cation transporter protein-like [Portunus trituberculatus]